MHKELLARGIRVGKGRVQRLMQQHGIKAKTKRKFVVTTDSRHSLPVAPDPVQRRFNPDAPNQIWTGDITYLATDEGWLYLAGVNPNALGRLGATAMRPCLHTCVPFMPRSKASKAGLACTRNCSPGVSGLARVVSSD